MGVMGGPLQMSSTFLRQDPRVGPPRHLPEGMARALGARLRMTRRLQRMTLVELAETTGVDAATISRIETGQMTGTIECHLKLAAALGIKLTDLYAGIEEARTKDATTFLPPSQRRDVSVHEAGNTSVAMLTTDILQKKLMPMLITIEPGGSTRREEARVGTERFLHILEGTLEAKVGSMTYTLKKGSSLYLDASVTHSFRNVGDRTAKCLSVMTPPTL